MGAVFSEGKRVGIVVAVMEKGPILPTCLYASWQRSTKASVNGPVALHISYDPINFYSDCLVSGISEHIKSLGRNELPLSLSGSVEYERNSFGKARLV
jgi:hypothetical protein